MLICHDKKYYDTGQEIAEKPQRTCTECKYGLITSAYLSVKNVKNIIVLCQKALRNLHCEIRFAKLQTGENHSLKTSNNSSLGKIKELNVFDIYLSNSIEIIKIIDAAFTQKTVEPIIDAVKEVPKFSLLYLVKSLKTMCFADAEEHNFHFIPARCIQASLKYFT